jgi:virginiamycin B lyase
MRPMLSTLVCVVASLGAAGACAQVRYFPVPDAVGAHDVAPDPQSNGPVYVTEQAAGRLGILHPLDGRVEEIDLGSRSAPHGVIIGPDGAAWITDGGRNAIVRFDPRTRQLRAWPLPADRGGANLNTAAFDGSGRIWFTGQSGVYGRLDPASGEMRVWDAPRGPGPYGITGTPSGEIYFASLAGSYIAHVDRESGAASVIEPTTAAQGARRLASDSHGRIWVSYWKAGRLGRYDPQGGTWKEWPLPGDSGKAYAICIDEQDHVWLSDWESNAILRFDPANESFKSFPSDLRRAQVRQLASRAHEIWGAESGNDRLVMIPTR